MSRQPTPSQALCAACNTLFNSVSTFDEHRDGPVDRRTCKPPESIGLRDYDGVWGPESYGAVLQKLVAARESKQK